METATPKRLGLGGGFGGSDEATALSVLSPVSAASLGVVGLAIGTGEGALPIIGWGGGGAPIGGGGDGGATCRSCPGSE